MRRMVSRLGRLLLIVAVLLAQHTALAHQYWHAASTSLAADGKTSPNGSRLCDLHDLLGTVLGVASGTAQTPAFLALAEPGFIAAAAVIREAALLAPHSRDPPLPS
jgi:hypothetical protein